MATVGFEDDLRIKLGEVAREKGIEEEVLVEAMNVAILKAAHATFGENRQLEAHFNPDSGSIDLFQYMTVVEEIDDDEREIEIDVARKVDPEAEIGEDLGFQIFWHPRDAAKAAEQDREYGDILGVKQARSAFGRIAAQTAKQVLMQKLREAERDLIFKEYKDRLGQLIRGIVRRFERGNLVIELGRTEGIIPFREQSPRDQFRPGDRVLALLKSIEKEARGPMLLLSRSDKDFVAKLFEAEVPEVYEKIVEVKAAARDPGSRCKVAVWSRDKEVDAQGACIGIKGSRVQAITQELRGEKIDIVQWHEDPVRFVIEAMKPAEVTRIVVDDSDKRMELVVPDEKLSLAIGRKGQNVRLASQLTGWKLDIIADSKFQKMEEEVVSVLCQIDGVSDDTARALYGLGFRTLEEIAEASPEDLVQANGVGSPDAANALKQRADGAIDGLRQAELRRLLAGGASLSDSERLRLVRGIGPKLLPRLERNGYKAPVDLADELPEQIAADTGLSVAQAEALRDAARNFMDVEEPAASAG